MTCLAHTYLVMNLEQVQVTVCCKRHQVGEDAVSSLPSCYRLQVWRQTGVQVRWLTLYSFVTTWLCSQPSRAQHKGTVKGPAALSNNPTTQKLVLLVHNNQEAGCLQSCLNIKFILHPCILSPLPPTPTAVGGDCPFQTTAMNALA